MNSNKSEQNKNSVSGNQSKIVGGNDYSNNTTYMQSTKSDIEILFDNLQIEISERKSINSKIEELESLTDNRDEIGLEQKLVDGGRQDEFEDAMELKEIYFKLLTKFQMYESGQKIHVVLLAFVWEKFKRLIYPRIKGGSSETEINELISEKIVEPLMNKISHGGLHTEMMITQRTIEGMIYYLTGTCRLKWV